ncbi:MAG: 16S rRNA (uracil(1498)-N(3))-methyltransferase [Flavobacteriales bacterium]
MNLFYTKNFSETNNELSEVEAKHCSRVLRKKDGDTIQVTNGEGLLFEGQVENVGKKVFVNVKQTQVVEKTRDYYLHIAIAPTKNMDRLEWFLEKCTEIGIDEISLIQTHHSERKRVRFDRVEKIVLSATKQSHQMHLPKCNDLVSFKQFIEQDFSDYKTLICHCEQDFEKKHLKSIQKANKYLILIGPEGDFSVQEIEKAYQNQFQGLHLGDNRLRTETAGIVACQNIQFSHYD